MLPPLDYPETKTNNAPESSDITYAALLDLAKAEKPITDEMIRDACKKMETAQQFPFSSQSSNDSTPIENLMSRIRSVRR